MRDATIGWFGIFRLGLVQASLGSIVVLTTSILNRVMVVELALPALLPGALVALHFGLQVLRPRLGYGSDTGGRTALWVIGGMAVLAVGGVGAAVATAWMATNPLGGIALAVLAFVLIGIGVGAAGTTLLALMAKCVAPARRAAAATTVWVMMISGFIVTTGIAGHLLDPYSGRRLILLSVTVSALALLATALAVWNIEPAGAAADRRQSERDETPFRDALRQVWGEPRARRFAIFVFFSMLAYSAQDLDSRAVRRHGVRLHAGPDDAIIEHSAQRGAGRHDLGGGPGNLGGWRIAGLDAAVDHCGMCRVGSRLAGIGDRRIGRAAMAIA